MKLLLSLLASILTYTVAQISSAIPIPNLPIPIPLPAPRSIPIVGEYKDLYDICENAGPDAYVGVHYADNIYRNFTFGECYPYSINGEEAHVAVFCKTTTCYSYANPSCGGGAVPPAPVLVPAGTVLPNVADFVQYLGQGAVCEPNGLSNSGL